MEKSDKVRIMSHLTPCHSLVSYTPMYEMRIKRSGSICWFYSCNSFYIFLNAILSLDNNSMTRRY